MTRNEILEFIYDEVESSFEGFSTSSEINYKDIDSSAKNATAAIYSVLVYHGVIIADAEEDSSFDAIRKLMGE